MPHEIKSVIAMTSQRSRNAIRHHNQETEIRHNPPTHGLKSDIPMH